MLHLSPQSIVFVATMHVDFRKGIDGLAAICRQKLLLEPLNGAYFLFYNRLRTSIKILYYDGQGFILSIKRLSKGTFKPQSKTNSLYRQICYRSLYILINNGDPLAANLSKDFKPLSSY